MSSIQLELPDGSIQEHPVGTTSRQIAEESGPGWRRARWRPFSTANRRISTGRWNRAARSSS